MAQQPHNTKAFMAGTDTFRHNPGRATLRDAIDHLEAGFWMEAVCAYGSIAAAAKHMKASRTMIGKKVNRFMQFRKQEPRP